MEGGVEEVDEIEVRSDRDACVSAIKSDEWR